MIEKILFDKDLIEKVIGRKNINILFLKYNPKERKAFYRTDMNDTYKMISYYKVINI